MINPSTVDIASLPSVALADRKQLPETPSIYFAIDIGGNVQYIGRSVNPRQRWATHHRAKQLESRTGIRIAYLSCDADLLPLIEDALIDWFNPLLNRQVTPEEFRIDGGRKNTTLRLDIEAVSAFRRLAKKTNMSLPKYVEALMVRHAIEEGEIPKDYELLGETRGGDRTTTDEAMQ